MQYRKFGATDLMVSETGFGAWAIGGGAMVGPTPIGWGDADDSVSEKALAAALDAGINFFDTADIYGLGHSETLIGRVLGNRPDVLVATKVGNVAREGQFTVDYTKNHILAACEASLRRLKRETIEYYQLHTARMAHLQQGDCLEAMEQLQQQGKIRYWGISLNTFYPDAEADFFMAQSCGHGFQLVWNLMNQRATGVIEKAAAKGYGVIARMPLQFGLLTGKISRTAGFASNDHRNSRLTPTIIDATLTILETKVWPMCERYGCSPLALAMAFVLGTPGISVQIPGIRTPQQAVANSAALPVLQVEDWQYLRGLAASDWARVMELIEKQG